MDSSTAVTHTLVRHVLHVTTLLLSPFPHHFRYRTFIQAVDTEPPPVDVAAFEQVRRAQQKPPAVSCMLRSE